MKNKKIKENLENYDINQLKEDKQKIIKNIRICTDNVQTCELLIKDYQTQKKALFEVKKIIDDILIKKEEIKSEK